MDEYFYDAEVIFFVSKHLEIHKKIAYDQTVTVMNIENT